MEIKFLEKERLKVPKKQSGWGVSVNGNTNKQTLKILCPHCEELVKVDYLINPNGIVEIKFSQFEK